MLKAVGGNAKCSRVSRFRPVHGVSPVSEASSRAVATYPWCWFVQMIRQERELKQGSFGALGWFSEFSDDSDSERRQVRYQN
ncbi:hypothetical protein RchiOBHm_Chr7g0227441 [Rosa chinensis]|uniref:Uncharacterized protein n=1 Tax=Rosa chinensis TaxID=74649 RepID=A0A2P6PEM3_ROSCH|nr:hypothetical protein RchiOBHm_Chr7g0227441 [Rosa chinensis]